MIVNENGFKQCSVCKKLKPAALFNKDKTRPDNRYPQCKVCQRKKANEQYHKNKHKSWYKKNSFKSVLKCRFGLTLEQYGDMLKKQNGVCAICGNPETKKGTFRLSVDHDHKTGKVRALLCDRCNRFLGIVDDNIKLFEKAIKYLKEYEIE